MQRSDEEKLSSGQAKENTPKHGKKRKKAVVEHLQTIPKVRKQAVAKLLRSLQTPVPLDKSLYEKEKTVSEDGTLPEDYFLTKRITQPIPGRLKKEEPVKEERLYAPETGMKGLMKSLNAGRYDLLTFYLNSGIDPRGFIMRAYYSNQSRYKASLHLVGLVSLLKTAADELSGENKSIDAIQCFPVLNTDGCFSEGAKEYLVPYLQRLFILREDQLFQLQHKFKAIPRSERFFACVEYDDAHRLSTFKMVLKYLKRHLKNGSLNPETIAKVSPILASFDVTLDEEDIETQVDSILTKLLQRHPELKNSTARADFFNQLIRAAEVTFLPHVSRENGKLLQLVVSPKIIEIVADYLYGKENIARPLYGYGIFSAQDIAQAARAHTRIINISDAHIEQAKQVHEAMTRAYSLAAHDIVHWYRMSSIPCFIRNVLIEFANSLHRSTGFSLSFLSFTILDMDHNQFVNIDERKRQSLDFNILKLADMYSDSISDSSAQYPSSTIQYHAAIMYETLKNPQFLLKAFESFPNYDESMIDITLKAICAACEGQALQSTDCESGLYQKLKSDFDPGHSTAYQVFQFVIKFQVPDHQLSSFAKELLLSVPVLSSPFKWTRNDGLLIELEDGAKHKLSHFSWDKNLKKLDIDFVIPFIKMQLSFAKDNRADIIDKIATIMKTTSIDFDDDQHLFDVVLDRVFDETEREVYLRSKRYTNT